jgi:hypothetical protein
MRKRGLNKPPNSKVDATSKTQFKFPQNWGILGANFFHNRLTQHKFHQSSRTIAQKAIAHHSIQLSIQTKSAQAPGS